MKDLIIVGASGYGREIIKYIDDINEVTPEWNLLGFLDDNQKALEGYECDYKVLGSIQGWQPKETEYFVCGLAFPQVKRKVVEILRAKGAQFATIIHPTARLSKHCHIGEGTVVTSNCSISDNAFVGDFVSLLGSGVAHDAHIGNYSTLSGRCAVNGHAEVGEMVYMGCGVLVAPSKKIGEGATVGIGSVVISNVKPGTTVFGNPAKRLDL